MVAKPDTLKNNQLVGRLGSKCLCEIWLREEGFVIRLSSVLDA